MRNRLILPFLVLTASIGFLSCEKQFSTDEPLPETFHPSLFISSENEFLYSLDPATGKKHWEFYIGRRQFATPVIIRDFLLLPTEDSLFKLDAKRGTVLHRYSFNDADFLGFSSSPTHQGDILYIGSTNDTLYALNVVEDRILWKFDADGPIISSPTISQGQLFVANLFGDIYAVDINTGASNWSVDLGGNVVSSPAVSEPYVYIGNDNGQLFSLYTQDGTNRWTYIAGSAIRSAPIVYGGNILFGSHDEYLYCVDSAAGVERWRFRAQDRIVSSPNAEHQVVYFGSHDHVFYAVNIIDGSLKWQFKTGAVVASSPLVKENLVYFGSHDKSIYAIDTSGQKVWSRNIDGLVTVSPVIWDLFNAYYPSSSGLSKYK